MLLHVVFITVLFHRGVNRGTQRIICVQSHRNMVEPRFTFRTDCLHSMLFLLSHSTLVQALEYTQNVLIVSSSSEIASQKAFFFLADILLLFFRIRKVVFRCWEIALWASLLTPSQEAVVGFCFLRVDYCHLRLCKVGKSSQICLGTVVGSSDPCCGSPILCPLTLVDY